ncbi:MAG TPA: LysR family transcriptional regulator [Xanthobacteraceae bacterium]|nr:LysR family transcriptional regulator [Xanthobacteraceae bacterium]
MINIPTELLRTLVAVVDHRSFTKAANMLGVTQPAVSAQIKRLQALLGAEVFDKHAPGVALTQPGEAVVTYARRLLALNDQILRVAAPAPVTRRLRIGITGDYFSPYLPRALLNFRKRWPYRKFQMTAGSNGQLLHDLRAGELDVVVLLTMDKPERDARHHWTEEMVWGRGASMSDPVEDPVPLVTRGDDWMNHNIAVNALEKAGRSYEFTLITPTILSLISAVRNGLGVMPFARRRILSTDLVICSEDVMPKLPDLVSSIYVSEAGDSEVLNALADEIAEVIRAPSRPGDRAFTPPGQFKELLDSEE